jgi:outer membrane protein OmpA-like peptidoglycan-associated protein
MKQCHGTCVAEVLIMQSRIARSVVTFVVLGLPMLAGCAPRVFADGTTFAIVGSLPKVEQVAVPSRIELREKVQFALDSDRILEVSHDVLDEAVAEILAEPRIRRIRVEGHASADGNDAHNLDLSARRAQSVRSYLIDHGVAADVLVAEGFGEGRPIADNESDVGREANRRVELHVIETTDGSTDTAAP